MTPPQDAIRVEDVGFRYSAGPAGAPPALDGVSFSVRSGEIFGILGPNGAGKTTLMKILGTVLLAARGTVEVLGHALPEGEEKVRPRLGVAFAEYERAFAFRLTGRQNLSYFGSFYGLHKRDLDERITRTLEQVGLTAKAGTVFQHYSTGMKHRLALARALLHGPDVLLLDEPTAGLDAQTARELGETLRKLAATGVAIVYTTHRLEEAANLCDRILILKDGRAAAMATPWELARLAEDVSVIELTTQRVLPDALDEIKALPAVASVTLTGRANLRVQTTDLDATTGPLVDWVESHKLGIASLRTSAASLTDAFVALTEGRIHDVRLAPAAEGSA